MWWDPTHEDFESFEGGLVDGLGELSKSKFGEFEARKKGLEDRIEAHKSTAPKRSWWSAVFTVSVSPLRSYYGDM